MNIDPDTFSSGQIESKIWLCEELEKLEWASRLTYIYGGWNGMLGFLLLSRGKFSVTGIRSLDEDPACESIADTINENWVQQSWKFKALTQDCNTFDPIYGDIIINTSTEHFTSRQWFDNIPKGTRVVLQGNNMPHDNYNIHLTLEDFLKDYPITNVFYKGEKEFVYPKWSFNRYMVIGIK